ncbi:hypothetical protein OIU85_023599 [Salix viminalis]|uniref:Uncharacterized protein n=1 Tax=Salix viminalis TaxID=40686 RepID=A0A9Q0TZ04_SALVM|nr:hypothetical protein OIU85_023599 [Salix viminalis]
MKNLERRKVICANDIGRRSEEETVAFAIENGELLVAIVIPDSEKSPCIAQGFSSFSSLATLQPLSSSGAGEEGEDVKVDPARVLFLRAVKLFTDGLTAFQWVDIWAFSRSLFTFEKSPVASLIWILRL